MPVRKLFEYPSIACSGPGESLSAVLMKPPQGEPLRLVYVVPLIGSGASQQLLLFKNMVKRGSALLSFEYRGHGASSGTFAMEKSLEDSRTVLCWAQHYASERGIPLHALSTCYGNIPMLAWFNGRAARLRVRTLNSVSGLFDLNHIIKVEDFLVRYQRSLGGVPLDAGRFSELVEQGAIPVEGQGYREALRQFLQAIFPELRVSREAFEALVFDRVDMRDTIVQFSRMRPLQGVAVPPDLPCLYFYGVRDELMGLDTPLGRLAYENRIGGLVPHAETRPMDIDHFGRGPDHGRVIEELCDFLERHDRS